MRRKAVILAGGQGSRVQRLLPGIPKPMALTAGRPFLEWVVRFLGKQGFNDITISTGFRSEIIAAHFSQVQFAGIDIRCESELEPCGTAGGFVNAVGSRASETDPWLVSNGDSLVLGDLKPMLDLLDSETQAVILGLHAEDCSRFGALKTDSQGTLLEFSEKRPGRGLINAGIYLLAAGLLRQFPSARPLSFETDVFPSLLAAGIRIAVSPTSAPFMDIGTEGTLPLAGQFVTTNRGHFL
ncbi:MAG: sugar phosphate nucleotidyltransferase [Terriglobales bacterium]